MIKSTLTRDGKVFDTGAFEDFKQVQEWALHRGGDYTLKMHVEGKDEILTYDFEECMEGLNDTYNVIGTIFIKNVEEKEANVMLVKSGNGSENYRLRIPTPWIKELGLNNTRTVIMQFDGNQILITKKEEM